MLFIFFKLIKNNFCGNVLKLFVINKNNFIDNKILKYYVFFLIIIILLLFCVFLCFVLLFFLYGRLFVMDCYELNEDGELWLVYEGLK